MDSFCFSSICKFGSFKIISNTHLNVSMKIIFKSKLRFCKKKTELEKLRNRVPSIYMKRTLQNIFILVFSCSVVNYLLHKANVFLLLNIPKFCFHNMEMAPNYIRKKLYYSKEMLLKCLSIVDRGFITPLF